MEPLGTLLPVYFVADQSASMAPHIGELNHGLLSLQDAMQRDPFAAAKVRFSVIGFSDDAFTYLEPADLRSAPQLPELTAQGRTSYCAAFEELAYRISVDLPRLKGHGFSVHRPVVFFLTDGAPTDREDWRAVRTRLLSQPAAPNILSFGIGDADPAVVGEIATKAGVRARGGPSHGHRCGDYGVPHLPDAVGDQFRQRGGLAGCHAAVRQARGIHPRRGPDLSATPDAHDSVPAESQPHGDPDQPAAAVDSHYLTPAAPDAYAPVPTAVHRAYRDWADRGRRAVTVGRTGTDRIPQYRSLAFRPDVALDGWSTDTVTVRGVSQRGHLHRYNGAPRQDDFAVHHLPDGRVIVAVADGVSQSPQSHLGASIAVTQAADWIRANLGPDTADLDWSALIKNTAYALTARAQTLFGLDEPDPVRAEQELATTLVCAVIEPIAPGVLRAHLVAVGDSSAWVLTGR